MRIKPLTGQVLIRILPRDTRSPGGIELPEHTASPEEVQEASHHPIPPPPEMGIVESIGPWPALRNGLRVLPPFVVGNRVIIGANSGQQMHRGIGDRLRMVRYDQVLAVLV